jgi:hypothetical protein
LQGISVFKEPFLYVLLSFRGQRGIGDRRDPDVVGEIRGRARWAKMQGGFGASSGQAEKYGREKNTHEKGGCQNKTCWADLGLC